jgi:hypothetical protein
MKPAVKLTFLLIALILFSANIHALDTDCIKKESYSVKPSYTLKVINKYGDVNIITGSNDSIALCAVAAIDQENIELVKKSLQLISIEATKNGDTITVNTVYDRRFFSQSFSNGRKSFNVNYTIEVPEYLNLILVNSFGNISVEKISGYVKIKLSRGKLYAKELVRDNVKPISSVTVDNGEVAIDKSGWLNLRVINCPTALLGTAKAAVLTSAFSTISIEKIGSLVIYSKSDRYTINNADRIHNESFYTKLDIRNLSELLESVSSYGSININNLGKLFTTVNISSDHSPVTIATSDDNTFYTDITVSQADLKYAEKFRTSLTRTNPDREIRLSGSIGNNPGSIIMVKAVSANVNLK